MTEKLRSLLKKRKDCFTDETQRSAIGRKAATFVALTESILFPYKTHDTDRPGGDRTKPQRTRELSMDDKDNCEADVYAAAETEKDEKVDPEKELCHGDDDGLSQLRGEESLTDMEGLPVRETLAKDHVEGNGFIPPPQRRFFVDFLRVFNC